MQYRRSRTRLLGKLRTQDEIFRQDYEAAPEVLHLERDIFQDYNAAAYSIYLRVSCR